MTVKATRGSSWIGNWKSARCAYRAGGMFAGDNVGFRLVRVPRQKKSTEERIAEMLLSGELMVMDRDIPKIDQAGFITNAVIYRKGKSEFDFKPFSVQNLED